MYISVCCRSQAPQERVDPSCSQRKIACHKYIRAYNAYMHTCVHAFSVFCCLTRRVFRSSPSCGCSGGEGTPPETLKCLMRNPYSWHRPGLNPGPAYMRTCIHAYMHTLVTWIFVWLGESSIQVQVVVAPEAKALPQRLWSVWRVTRIVDIGRDWTRDLHIPAQHPNHNTIAALAYMRTCIHAYIGYMHTFCTLSDLCRRWEGWKGEAKRLSMHTSEEAGRRSKHTLVTCIHAYMHTYIAATDTELQGYSRRIREDRKKAPNRVRRITRYDTIRFNTTR